MVAVEFAADSGAAPRTVGELSRVVRTLLREVADDGVPADLDPLRWRLMIGGEEIFCLAFASFYPRDHPRYSACESAFVVLQFRRSFFRLGGLTPFGIERIKRRVRRDFERAGYTYFSGSHRRLPEVYRVVKPVTAVDPPVEWWRETVKETNW